MARIDDYQQARDLAAQSLANEQINDIANFVLKVLVGKK